MADTIICPPHGGREMDVVVEMNVDSSATSTEFDSELPYSLSLELTINDRDTIAELWRHPEGESREDFALGALRIGVLALQKARGQVDGEVVRREAERMLTELSKHLGDHARSVEDQVTATFRHYFAPGTGQFNERIDRLLKCDGELERALRAQVGGQDSVLCRTLTAHIGEQSPLMRMLGPSEKDGLLNRLSKIVESELNRQSEQILCEFSLDKPDGALNRLLNQLTEKNDKVGESLNLKVEQVTKQFSLNEENSFFSQLSRTLKQTSETIHNNLTLDDKNSSLSRLQTEMQTILKEHGKSNQDFQEEVKRTLNSLVVRREESLRSTTHGKEFQAIVGDFLIPFIQKRGDIIECTGDMVGSIKNCKKGDFVVELGPDSAAPGAKVVIEAKAEKKYTLPNAREEIDTARGNRNSESGLFVFSSGFAPAGLEAFSRIGNDVFVIWDQDNPASDVYLQAGFEVAKALCLRAKVRNLAQSSDFGVIDAVILDIEKRAKSLEEVATWAETIRNNAGKIIDRAKTAKEEIARQVENLQERLADLKDTLSKP